MGYTPGRRSNGGLKGSTPKSRWVYLAWSAALAVLWLTVTILLVPPELASINKKLSSVGIADDTVVAEDERPAPNDWNAAHDPFPSSARRHVRPSKDRPRANISMATIVNNMRSFLDELDIAFKNVHEPEPMRIWNIYKAAVDRWLLPMDKISEAQTLFEVRDDRSIFVSVASYRDENCPTTLKEMYSKADRPENLYVGLVQQNCVSGCRTGVLEGGIVDDTDPDINCYDAFCSTPLGNTYCRNVRNFFVDEAEALGPAVARYFASKLWGGETFFMQIDAHSLFEKGWDSTLVKDITNTPSYPYSVLSHYPPDTKAKYQEQPGYRICGGEFAASPIEHDIIRLAAGIPHDNNIKDKPCPAPFIGAGFFFVHASVLADVPFDPYVPWVFMGEEILLSLRFWTWGYDIYSPTRNVLSHFYIRRHTPKFWESVNRLFHKPSIHNDVTGMVINRVKNVAGYPESSSDVLMMPSLLTALDLYGDGNVRAMEDYMALVGLDMTSKIAKPITWCKQCTTPYPV